MTYVKTDFQVLKLKFYACYFKQVFYRLYALYIAWTWQHENTFFAKILLPAFISYLVAKPACVNAAYVCSDLQL